MAVASRVVAGVGALRERLTRGEPSFHGVHREFPDVYEGDRPPTLDAWHGGYWQQLSHRKLRDAIDRAEPVLHEPYSTVGLLVNRLSAGGECRVLDFGGGTGFVYQLVKPALREPERVAWHVVDGMGITHIGEQARRPDDRLLFALEAESGARFDLLYLNTVLQYVDDWRGVLRRLLEPRPRVVAFTRLLAGEVPSFVTRQVIGGVPTPCRFLNLGELLAVLREFGYGVDLLASTDPLAGEYADDIPVSHRLERETTLVVS